MTAFEVDSTLPFDLFGGEMHEVGEVVEVNEESSVSLEMELWRVDGKGGRVTLKPNVSSSKDEGDGDEVLFFIAAGDGGGGEDGLDMVYNGVNKELRIFLGENKEEDECLVVGGWREVYGGIRCELIM